MTFANILDECQKLKLDDLTSLLEILNNRAREKRREQIYRAAMKGRADRKAGKKFKTLADLEKI
ncbi:MAG: hypothetical protein BWY90_00119 [Deltaproteobacteria bacterium ADurb.BinA014]|mgnify:CR=1 FL=1|nr:MAG: hypothetical protein BWY90_00119 [Deltaproteobacteria bacterium ADurb.BinA014]